MEGPGTITFAAMASMTQVSSTKREQYRRSKDVFLPD
jgi:hypothetical protein